MPDVSPITFWSIGDQTFNEKVNAFVDRRCFFQEFDPTDNIKLQLGGDIILENEYGLRLVDKNGLQVGFKSFTKTLYGTANYFDIEFTFAEFTLSDQYIRFYISLNPGTLDDETLDIDTLDTFGSGTDVYKSDFIFFNSNIALTQSWGTRLFFFKSLTNFAGIKYPNNGNYFALRVPCRFYKPRNTKVTTQLPLSQSNIVTTSIVSTSQQLLEMVLLPHYILNKIELILQHCVNGTVIIDGIEWQADESFDRKDVDVRCAFDEASTWLSKGVIRNII